jgi:Zn-finger in ubiquitin-hydrolases and other protein
VAQCTHLDTVHFTELPDPPLVCAECVAMGSYWVHLRMCHECGKVACCDNSPNRHATKHFHASGHPLIRSAEPGEDWTWCYVDELFFRLVVPSAAP